jgi:hypothetical protein
MSVGDSNIITSDKLLSFNDANVNNKKNDFQHTIPVLLNHTTVWSAFLWKQTSRYTCYHPTAEGGKH